MTTGATLSIALAVDPAVVKEVSEELASAGPAKLKDEADKIDNILEGFFKAAGDDLDVSADAIKELEGFDCPVKERAAKVVQLHSRAAAIQDLRADRSRIEHIKAEIEQRRMFAEMGIDQNIVPFPGQPAGRAAVPRLSDGIYAAARESGIDIPGLKDRAAVPFQVDMDARAWMFPDIYGAVVTTDAGWDPFVVRLPGATPAISRPLQLYDVIPMSSTMQHAISYMIQSTRTVTNVVEKAEGGASGEATMEWTEVTESMREDPRPHPGHGNSARGRIAGPPDHRNGSAPDGHAAVRRPVV